MHARHGALHVFDHSLDIGRQRAAMVDDEVRVLVGYRGIADAKALEAGAFDQARRVVARRIGEYRSAAPFADGLRLLALVEQFANGFGVDPRRAVELQPRTDEPRIVRPLHAAVAYLV